MKKSSPIFLLPEWPHAPAHRFTEKGAYIITGGTIGRFPFFNTAERLNEILGLLFACATEFHLALQAWVLLANHYHFIAFCSEDPESLGRMLKKFHAQIALMINRQDGITRRKVMYQFWDTHITYASSYWARINYVHNNPVHHGIVERASNYPWCSAAWFERTARPSLVKTVYRFKTDAISVIDDF